MAFTPPPDLIVAETSHWIVNHRVDSSLPGYLMVGCRLETTNPSELPPATLAEMWPLLAAVQRALAETLHPDHIYLGRYGHQAGHSFHIHVIPIYSWVKEAFTADSRYAVLKSFYTPGAQNSNYDGAEMTLYVWREFCESKNPPPVHGPRVAEAIALLRENLSLSHRGQGGV